MRPLDGIAHIERIDRNAHNHLKEYVSNMFHISAFMTYITIIQKKIIVQTQIFKVYLTFKSFI